MLILKKLLVVYVKSNLTRHFVFLFAKSGVPKLRFLGSFMPRTIGLNREPTQAPEDGAERGGKEQKSKCQLFSLKYSLRVFRHIIIAHADSGPFLS